MTKQNPRVEPTAEAYAIEAEIRANGGNLTAEEWQFTQTYERHGWSPSRTGALRMAEPDGCIVGSAGSWSVCRLRK